MTFTEYYEYAWFSNMAYVKWNEANTLDRLEMIRVANNEERIPNNPLNTGPQLGEEIFNNQNWSVTSFHPNDSSGFAANVFEKDGTNEKALAIRGTQFGLGWIGKQVPELHQLK